MAEQTSSEHGTPTAAGSGSSELSAGGAGRRGGQVARSGEALESARGSTSLADVVVTKVASIAAREVPGVYELGAASRARSAR